MLISTVLKKDLIVMTIHVQNNIRVQGQEMVGKTHSISFH